VFCPLINYGRNCFVKSTPSRRFGTSKKRQRHRGPWRKGCLPAEDIFFRSATYMERRYDSRLLLLQLRIGSLSFRGMRDVKMMCLVCQQFWEDKANQAKIKAFFISPPPPSLSLLLLLWPVPLCLDWVPEQSCLASKKKLGIQKQKDFFSSLLLFFRGAHCQLFVFYVFLWNVDQKKAFMCAGLPDFSVSKHTKTGSI
jgi:hypothetical protein